MGAVETRGGIVCVRVLFIYLFIYKKKGIFRGARKDDGKKTFAPFTEMLFCFSQFLILKPNPSLAV